MDKGEALYALFPHNYRIRLVGHDTRKQILLEELLRQDSEAGTDHHRPASTAGGDEIHTTEKY